MLNDDQTPAEAEQRAGQISNVRYSVHVTVDDTTSKTFVSSSTITFDSNEAATWIDLDAQNIREATLNGKSVDISAYKDGRLAIEGLQATGNELRIVADCAYSKSGVGLHRQVDEDGEIYMYSNCEPFDAHRWFACFDQPDIKGRLKMAITAPSRWVARGNWPEAAAPTITDNGATATTSYEETIPISTYLMAMAAGPFKEYQYTTASGIELRLYVRQSLAKYFDHDFFFEVTEKGIEFYTQLFGRPLPCPKYDQVLCPQFNSGAMENIGLVTYRDELCIFKGKPTDADRSTIIEFILHEMAHMWFGDEVTLRQWKDLWLNESSADLFEKLSQDAIYPDTHIWADFANGRKAWGLADDQLPSSHPVADKPKPVSRSRDNFDGISYAKGGAALYQLIHYIGFDKFVSGLRSYFRTYAQGNASLEDYLAKMENASALNLADWAQRWLQTVGMNKIVADTQVANGTFTRFALRQEFGSGDDILRPHVIRVGLYNFNADGVLERTKQAQVTMRVDADTTEIPELAGQKVPDLVLVNDDDLTYAKIRLDDKSRQTMLSSLSKLSDPLARATLWGIVWDMTRDGDLTAHEYIDCITKHAPFETQTTILSGRRSLLGKASSAINVYANPAERDKLRAQLSATSKATMLSSEPGSDMQLTWADAYISSSDSPADLDFIAGLLDGSSDVPGLAVDTNVRWHVVNILAVNNRISDTEIEREAKRDGTDQGARNALTARALRPTAKAKALAWGKITSDPDLSLYDRRAWLAGFMHPRQEKLLAPYVAKYAQLVPQLWSGDWTPVEARALTEGLYPTPVVSDQTVAMVDDVLKEDLPPPARKILLDQQDGTRRALHARAVDSAACPDQGSRQL